jgi:hypothetical protein
VWFSGLEAVSRPGLIHALFDWQLRLFARGHSQEWLCYWAGGTFALNRGLRWG